MAFLHEVTIGIYQVNFTVSYIQDKMQREGTEEFQLNTYNERSLFLRAY